MKKILLSLLAVIVVLGLFAATGYTGYRMGYAQGMERTADGQMPEFRPFERMGPGRMPMHEFGFGRGFDREFRPGGFPMMGFGFFPMFGFLWRVAILALIVGLVYWLFTRSGWQLTRTQTTRTVETPPQSAETETKE
jgi:uncharacterized membrane protein